MRPQLVGSTDGNYVYMYSMYRNRPVRTQHSACNKGSAAPRAPCGTAVPAIRTMTALAWSRASQWSDYRLPLLFPLTRFGVQAGVGGWALDGGGTHAGVVACAFPASHQGGCLPLMVRCQPGSPATPARGGGRARPGCRGGCNPCIDPDRGTGKQWVDTRQCPRTAAAAAAAVGQPVDTTSSASGQ